MVTDGSWRTRIPRIALSILVCFGLGHSSAIAAADDVPQRPGHALVVLGDSYTANGLRLDGDSLQCNHGPAAWPIQLSQLMGVAGTPDFVDVSCSGASLHSKTAYTVLHEARLADAAGAFGPDTKVVALQFGMNDTWGSSEVMLWDSVFTCIFNLRDGCDTDALDQQRIPDYRGLTPATYADRIRQVIDFIKYYAPQAKIVFVGYPELAAPNSDVFCANVLGVTPIVQGRGRALAEYLNRLDDAQRKAADMLGASFFDTRAVTAGHGLCSAEPWVNGFFDPRADFLGMPFHPDARGDTALATALRRWIAG
ncbi:SGNH/GDSL hydrolase family protein [Nocardia sp. NPDC046763]|uniref:SGNH/GDSL hydrolase family protein n=1 Tax=Nocardia sp. NPDC046763 TaxID=3155256 RepID=UPI0033F6FA5A